MLEYQRLSRFAYLSTIRDAASKKANRHASAQAELNAIGEAMLAERLPHLAMKYAVTHGVHGDHAVLTKLSEK